MAARITDTSDRHQPDPQHLVNKVNEISIQSRVALNDTQANSPFRSKNTQRIHIRVRLDAALARRNLAFLPGVI